MADVSPTLRAHSHTLPEPDQGWGTHLIDAHGYAADYGSLADPDRARAEHERLHADPTARALTHAHLAESDRIVREAEGWGLRTIPLRDHE